MSSSFEGVRFRQLAKGHAKRIQLQSVFRKTASHDEYLYDLRIPFIWSFTGGKLKFGDTKCPNQIRAVEQLKKLFAQ